MQHDKTIKVSFGLREIAGERRLVSLDYQSNAHATCCGEQTVTLAFIDGAPYFGVSTARRAQRALAVNPEWFNSSDQSPSWGMVDTSLLEVVQVIEVLEMQGVALPRPVVFSEIINSFPVSHDACQLFLGYALPELDTQWSYRLVYVPEGETFDSLLRKCTKHAVFLGKKSVEYYSWGVMPAPDGMLGSVEAGREAVLLCVSTNHPDDFTDIGESN